MAAETATVAGFAHELLLRTATVAARAPSSHNSQPWALAALTSPAARAAADELMSRQLPSRTSPQDEAVFAIAIDRARELRALPDLHVEMVASCGMFLHALLELLRVEGWRGVVGWCGDGQGGVALPGWPASWRALALVRLTPTTLANAATRELVERRRTDRGPYARARLDTRAVARIEAAKPAFRASRTDSVHVSVIEGRAVIERAAAFVRRHAKRDFVDAAAWGETYSYIRFREAEARREDDGFDIAQLFGPLGRVRRSFLRLALSPRAMQALRWTPYANVIARGLGDRVADSGGLLCVTSRDRSPDAATLLDAGGAVMDAWLRATAEGLSIHPVSVVLQHADLRASFERELRTRGRLLFFARVGRPEIDGVSTVGMTARRAPSLITL